MGDAPDTGQVSAVLSLLEEHDLFDALCPLIFELPRRMSHRALLPMIINSLVRTPTSVAVFILGRLIDAEPDREERRSLLTRVHDLVQLAREGKVSSSVQVAAQQVLYSALSKEKNFGLVP